MILNLPLFSLIFFAGGVITLALAVVIWKRRPAPGTVPLSILLLSAAIWCLSSAFEVGSTELTSRLIFGKISYLGVVSNGVFWLIFTLDYSGSKVWRRPRNLIWLCAIPVITLVLAWTNELHGWVWSEVYPTLGPLGVTWVWEHGPWFLVNPLYQYLLYFSGIFVLIRFGLQRRKIYRKQVIILILGTLIPVIGSILYVLRIDPAGGYDLTPLYMCVASIIYSITIIQFHFMNILPVAYQELVKINPDGILVLDLQGNIMEMNQATEKIKRLEKSSVQGTPLSEVWPELNQIVTGPAGNQPSELSVGTPDSPLTVYVRMVDLIGKKNAVVGQLVVLRDISDLKNAHQKLEALYASEHRLRGSLEEEIQKRSQYSRAIVHELKTPLTSIIATVDLLQEQVKDPLQTRMVQNILRSSVNLEQRVNELFELARGELGLIKIEPVPLDMGRLIIEIAAEITPVAQEKGLKLRTEIPAAALTVRGDKSRLRQVLINLLGNSIKFTSRGGIIIRADRYDNAFLRVQVEDSGSGIDSEQMENLFDPYRRHSRENGTTSGMGLGLSLSKIFVELHHGRIWAESRRGQGTTISFTVPFDTPVPSLAETDNLTANELPG